MKTDVYADSTIAMSIYNFACSRTPDGKIYSTDQLFVIVQKKLHPELSKNQFDRVINVMQEKGMLINRDGALYPRDKQKRIILSRDRDDCSMDDEGRICGGWNGWVVEKSGGGVEPFNSIDL